MNETKQKYFTVAEMREYLGVGYQMSYRLLKMPGFPVIKLSPRKILIPKDKLDAWMNEQAGKATAEGGEKE